jgi:hypothetical protein
MGKYIEMGIYVEGIYLVVNGNYYSEEEPIMYDSNMEGYPGCSAEFELQSALVENTDIVDLISDEIFGKIIQEVIENYKNE